MSYTLTGKAYPLHNPLSKHGLNHLLKSGDVGACNIIACNPVSFSGIRCLCLDVDHDGVKLLIHFLKGPGHPEGVLALLKS